ncbi:MAG: hypothetical protein M1831_007574 [Alyxoria varia]|nr:MAG: hypothetical protein M1831_007574 [Alyxoria varia]
MHCGICSTDLDISEANCAVCARAALYPQRIQHAQVLLDKERLQRQIESAFSVWQAGLASQDGKPVNGTGLDPVRASTHLERINRDTAESKTTIHEVNQQTATLRKHIGRYREEIEQRKTALKSRRDDLKSARTALEIQRREALEPVKYETKKTARRLEAVYKETVSARVYLCRSAASLSGLSRFPDSSDSSGNAFVYHIGGICLPDIRYINNFEPEQVTASLTNIVRLLCLICSYLHVRLPAEIILPHRDYPLPTIYSPASSYGPTRPPMPFPAPTTSSSSNPLIAGLVASSPKASPIFDQQGGFQTNIGGRPRPLFLDRKLSRLVREDPAAYAHFVEGVALLAWDVAWLCRTQGVVVASTDWRDVCQIGRNLWEMLIGPRRPGLSRRNTPKTGVGSDKEKDRAAESPKGKIKDRASESDRGRLPNSNILGVFSHGSTLNFLHGSNAPTAYLPLPAVNVPPSTVVEVSSRGWRFASPVKVLHELKSVLAAEMSGLDWEVLDGVDEDELMGESGGLGAVDWQDKGAARGDTPEVVDNEDEEDEGGVIVDEKLSSAESSPKKYSKGNRQASRTTGWYRLRSRNDES